MTSSDRFMRRAGEEVRAHLVAVVGGGDHVVGRACRTRSKISDRDRDRDRSPGSARRRAARSCGGRFIASLPSGGGVSNSGSCMKMRAWVDSLSLALASLLVTVIFTRLGRRPFWPSGLVVSQCPALEVLPVPELELDLSMSRSSTSYSATARLPVGWFEVGAARGGSRSACARLLAIRPRHVRDHGLLRLVRVGPQHAVVERREPDLGTLDPPCATNIVRGCLALRLRSSTGRPLEVGDDPPSAIRSSWLRSSELLVRACALARVRDRAPRERHHDPGSRSRS